MKKILFVTAKNIERGGVEAFLLNWISQLSPNEYQLSWLFPGMIINKSMAEELTEKNVELIPGNHNKSAFKKFFSLFLNVYHLAVNEKFSIIHVNTGSVLINAVALTAAKLGKIEIRIAHSHSCSGALNRKKTIKLVNYILRFFVNYYSTKKVACSTLAAEALFGKKHANEAIIVKNMIDTKKFAFSEESRDTLRKRFSLEGCFVIGQVARLAPEKNQKFLLDILNEIIKKDDTSRLLLVGEGPLENELRTYAKELGIEEYVVFAGATAEPEKYYSAMDVFVLTSFFEGLPITGVEAQTSGLLCFFSETITHDVSLTENTDFLPLEYSPDVWAEKILDYANNSKKINRNDMYLKIIESGYDKSSIKNYMSDLYDVTQ